MLKLGTDTVNIPFAKAYLSSGLVYEKNVEPQYTELSYIEGTGTQYIDTNYQHKRTTKYIFDALVPDITKNYALGVGAGSSGSQQQFLLYLNANTNKNTCAFYYGSSSSTNASVLDVSQRHTYEMTGTGTVKQDGTTIFTRSAYSFSNTLNTYLIKGNYANAARNGASGRIYNMKIYENDTLIKEFIPAKRNSDNAIGMYETVGGTFYGNAGTGDFIAGNVVTASSLNTASLMNTGALVGLGNTANLDVIDKGSGDTI